MTDPFNWSKHQRRRHPLDIKANLSESIARTEQGIARLEAFIDQQLDHLRARKNGLAMLVKARDDLNQIDDQ